MRAGLLRQRIRVETATQTRDAHGGITYTWKLDAIVWGMVKPIAGQEFFTSQQVNSDITHIVRIRYWSGLLLTPSQRLVHRDRNLNIKSVVNLDERRREVEVMCTEATT